MAIISLVNNDKLLINIQYARSIITFNSYSLNHRNYDNINN